MEYLRSPRSSSRQGSTSITSGRISSRGPSHSTPVKSYDDINSCSAASHNRSTPSYTNKSGASSSLSDVNKNFSLTLGHSKQASLNSSSLSSNSRKAKRVIRSPFAGVSAETEAQDRANESADAQQAKMADYENQTIQKQRAELTLLVTELRDRDRELNDMVTAHQKQLSAWEQDRRKISDLQDKCGKLEREIQNKNDDVRALSAKLRVVECEDQDKTTALNNTQEQLVLMSEQQSQTSVHMHDLEQRNRSLSATVHDMSCSVGQLEAREQELITVLQLKDRDLSEASTRLAEVSAKLKKMEVQYTEAKDSESENRRKMTDWKNKSSDQQREIEYTKTLMKRSEQRCDEQHVEIQRLRQEISTLKKELILAGEREKRKDQLLDLQRSKQERTDSELANIRQLYERQQKDLSLLHVNLENTKDLLYKNNISVPGMGSIGLPKSSPSSRRTYCYGSSLSNSSYRSYGREPTSSTYKDSSVTRYTTDSPGQYKPDSTVQRHTNGLRTSEREKSYNWPMRSYDDRDYESTDPYSPKVLNDSTDNQDNSKMSSLHSNGGFHDDDGLEVQLSETPPPTEPESESSSQPGSEKKRTLIKTPVIIPKETSVKESDSAATKLHKLLTESRDMVEELERSVGDHQESGENPREIPSPDMEQIHEVEDLSSISRQNDTNQLGEDILTNGDQDD